MIKIPPRNFIFKVSTYFSTFDNLICNLFLPTIDFSILSSKIIKLKNSISCSHVIARFTTNHKFGSNNRWQQRLQQIPGFKITQYKDTKSNLDSQVLQKTLEKTSELKAAGNKSEPRCVPHVIEKLGYKFVLFRCLSKNRPGCGRSSSS